VYRYEARNARNQVGEDEESKLEPKIITTKPIEGAGKERCRGEYAHDPHENPPGQV
jgi:hypothetical protein